MKRVFAAILTAIALAFASPVISTADAHRAYSGYTAQQHLYDLYQSHCGNGTAWLCQSRLLNWSATPVGDHSWAVYYSWIEVYVPTANSRWCDVYVRDDTHV
jgi:hypothetical protein